MINIKLLSAGIVAAGMIFTTAHNREPEDKTTIAAGTPDTIHQITKERDYPNGLRPAFFAVNIDMNCRTGTRTVWSAASPKPVLIDFTKDTNAQRVQRARAECAAQGITPGF